jgi:acyl dehydratase
MNDFFGTLAIGHEIEGAAFTVSRESIRAFCDASLDYNPLHLDDTYMQGNFGKTKFGGVIMHGMNNFGLITRMLTDWSYARSGIHRRLETRWRAPVYPGDIIQPKGTVTAKTVTVKSRWVTVEVEVRNQRGEQVATGEAQIEFPVAVTVPV